MAGLVVAGVGLSLLLSACQTAQGPKEGLGGLSGAVIGGFLGSQIGKGDGQLAATAAGALLGMYAGSSIGRSLDEVDRLMMAQATQQALESGQSDTSVEWRNPDTGHSGEIIPARAYSDSRGLVCRPFTQTIVVDDQIEEVSGTACRNRDGAWEIQA